MNLHELFADQLDELAGMEQLSMKGLPLLVKASSNAELQAAFQNHLQQTGVQLVRIKDSQAALWLESKTKACEPMLAMLADATSASLVEPEGVIRDLAMLGAAERIEHFEAAAYASTISLAKTLGYGDAANLLVENLQEELKAAEHLKKISKTLLKQAQEDASR